MLPDDYDETFAALRQPIAYCRGVTKPETVSPETVSAWLTRMATVCGHRHHNPLCQTCRQAIRVAETVDRVGPVTVHPAR